MHVHVRFKHVLKPKVERFRKLLPSWHARSILHCSTVVVLLLILPKSGILVQALKHHQPMTNFIFKRTHRFETRFIRSYKFLETLPYSASGLLALEMPQAPCSRMKFFREPSCPSPRPRTCSSLKRRSTFPRSTFPLELT